MIRHTHPRSILLFAAVALLVSTKAFSQSAYQPLGQPSYEWLDRIEIRSGRFLQGIHTSVKPYTRQ
ncbi:MAG TPA: hypothetical protein VEY71_06000, partial [Chitinophagales bacterium]|nr:hypothetical protein [Chitinophagales bacterium]